MMKSSKVGFKGVQLLRVAQKGFRDDFPNPYKHDPLDLTETERRQQESKPVWERQFDHKKYMEHDGPLKVTKRNLIIIVIHRYSIFRCRAIPQNEAYEALLFDLVGNKRLAR